MGMSQHAKEVAAAERFEFGQNWVQFLQTLNDDKIKDAIESLKINLETESLADRSFLDIGSARPLAERCRSSRGGGQVSSPGPARNRAVACIQLLQRLR